MPNAKLPWPLFTLDFEASGLGEFTYPIEIGITRWAAPDAAIETWSALIRPTDDWHKYRPWHAASEAVHGIRREQLDEGLTPAEALCRANEMVGTHFAFCDGGEHDLRWLMHLAHAAGFPPTFRLADWDALGGALTREQYGEIWDLAVEPVTHRAGADAERLMRALARGLGITPG